MGKSFLAVVTLGLLAAPAFGITFMSLNENIFEAGSLTVQDQEMDASFLIESAAMARRFMIPTFADAEDITAFPEM